MRKLILSLMVVSLMVLPLAAESTRTNSMNLHADDIVDIANTASFPQEILNYQNKVWYNALDGGSSLSKAALITELSSYTVGVVISEEASILNLSGTTDLSFVTSADLLQPDKKVDLLFGGELGAGALGIDLFYATNSDKSETDADNVQADPDTSNELVSRDNSSSYMGMILGYGMEAVGPLASLDVSMMIGIPGLESKYSDPPLETAGVAATTSGQEELVKKDGGMDLGLNLLGVYELSSDSNLRIQVKYGKESLDLVGTEKVANGDLDYNDANEQVRTTRNYSGSTMGLRAALNKTVNDDELVVLAIGMERSASTTELSTENTTNDRNSDGVYDFEKDNAPVDKTEGSTLSIPVVIAVEGTMKENISLRIGAKKSIMTLTSGTVTDDTYAYYDGAYKVASTSVTETSAKTNDSLTLTLGAGVDFNNFTINADIAQDLLFNGPYFINGTSNTFAGALDVIYSF